MPSLSELSAVFQSMPQARSQARMRGLKEAQQVALGQQTLAQTQGLQAQTQKQLAELETYQAREELRGLNRQLDVLDRQRKLRPEYQRMMDKLADSTAYNQISAQDRQKLQTGIDMFKPVFAAIRSNDSTQVAKAVAAAERNPYMQELLQDPEMGPILQGIVSGDPKAIDGGMETVRQIEAFLQAPGGRTTAADRAKAEHASKLNREEEAAKQAAIQAKEIAVKERESELTAKTPDKPSYANPIKPEDPDVIEGWENMVKSTVGRYGTTAWHELSDVSTSKAASTYLNDYAAIWNRADQGMRAKLPTPSEYIAIQLQRDYPQEIKGAAPTEGFVGNIDENIVKQYQKQYPDRTREEIIKAIQRVQ